MANILLVEDDSGIREALQFSFQDSKHNIVMATCVAEAKQQLEANNISLVLLDVTLPDGNGFELYQNTISEMRIQTMFLTAKDEENDIVKGFEMGAEDYITKPFSIRELQARINRTLARISEDKLVTIGDITYNLDKMEVTRAGELIKLSSLELKILNEFIENKEKVVRRTSIIDLIWDATGNDVYDHTVTVYIKRIRTKLGVDIFKTVKGVGYRLAREEEL